MAAAPTAGTAACEGSGSGGDDDQRIGSDQTLESVTEEKIHMQGLDGDFDAAGETMFFWKLRFDEAAATFLIDFNAKKENPSFSA